EMLKEKINSLLASGKKKLLLNLEAVPYIDSAGLGEVVRTFTTVSRSGGSLKLLNLTKRIEDLLSITKLLTVFDTFESEADAVKSYTKKRGHGVPGGGPCPLASPGPVDQESYCFRGADLRAPIAGPGRRGACFGGLFDFLSVIRRRLFDQ